MTAVKLSAQNLRPNSKLQDSDSKVSERYVKSSIKLAEWTGLEPATPGVTGLGQNPMLVRVCGWFDIPKTGQLCDNVHCGSEAQFQSFRPIAQRPKRSGKGRHFPRSRSGGATA
jgi:hypothetical protein